MTNEEYYSSEDNHGNYQYIGLGSIIDSLEMEKEGDNDSLLKGVPRHLLVKYALDGVRDLTNSGDGDEMELELEIGQNLQFITPPDFVDYLQVFVIGTNNELLLLEYNSKMNIAKSFLQDDEFNVVFDDLGKAIEVDGNNVYNEPSIRYQYFGRDFNTQTNINTSAISRNGDFKVDKRRGVIAFSSALAGRNIVLRYLSDGLQQHNIDNEKVTVNKHIKIALEDYIFWRAISRRKNTSQSATLTALNRFKTSRHKASILVKDISANRIARVMRGHFKPLKF